MLSPSRLFSSGGGGGSSSGGRKKKKKKNKKKALKRWDKVEANFKGKGKWFKGKVSRVNDDDTYDILFDDGDRERKVPRDRIRTEDDKGDSDDDEYGSESGSGSGCC